MSGEKGFLSPPSPSGTAPPPYRFHQVPQTPSTSRPSSRPGSPPHGGSVPMPGPSSGSGDKGGFSLDLGRSGQGKGGILFPLMVLKSIFGLLLRRWKTVIFVVAFGTLAAFGMFGAMWTEWREMTYYRVDPYPQFSPAHPHPGGAHEEIASGHQSRPIQPISLSTCPGPKAGMPIPRAPLKYYKTPETHPIPLVGDYKLVNLDNSKCLTYRDRYSMYTDDALGITYRQDLDEEMEETKRKKAALYDDDPDNLKPTASTASNGAAITGGQGAFGGQGKSGNSSRQRRPANKSSSSGSSTTTASHAKATKIAPFNNTDPLYGPQKPANWHEGDWERYLRDRTWRANLRSEELGPISFPDWRALMDACFEKRERERGRAAGVDPYDPTSQPLADVIAQEMMDEDIPAKFKTTPETKRTALVMRAYEGYVWREDDILNMRALIGELSLNNPNTPYDIRILVEVHGRHLSVFTSEWDRLNVLRSSVPREFWGMVELWTEDEMCALYPGLPGKFLNHMIAQSSYRSCLMALQKFYLDHQEYDFVWNWEMDVRYIGNYLDYFEGIEEYSRKEPLHVGMDKYDSWFVRNVSVSEENWRDNATLIDGRGDEADLITLGPVFDPRGSGWFWEYDVQNYPKGEATHRRASIGTNMRMSRSLLDAMNVVNAEAKKSLHCEAWPTTLVLHSQLPISHDHSFYPEAGFTHNLPLPFKGVFAPHPVYFRHYWDPEVLHSRINRPDFYKKANEKIMRDSAFYYDGAHAKEIYVGWKAKESVCRAPVLLHPIKRIN